jgi:hypothetical protein
MEKLDAILQKYRKEIKPRFAAGELRSKRLMKPRYSERLFGAVFDAVPPVCIMWGIRIGFWAALLVLLGLLLGPVIWLCWHFTKDFASAPPWPG